MDTKRTKKQQSESSRPTRARTAKAHPHLHIRVAAGVEGEADAAGEGVEGGHHLVAQRIAKALQRLGREIARRWVAEGDVGKLLQIQPQLCPLRRGRGERGAGFGSGMTGTSFAVVKT